MEGKTNKELIAALRNRGISTTGMLERSELLEALRAAPPAAAAPEVGQKRGRAPEAAPAPGVPHIFSVLKLKYEGDSETVRGSGASPYVVKRCAEIGDYIGAGPRDKTPFSAPGPPPPSHPPTHAWPPFLQS